MSTSFKGIASAINSHYNGSKEARIEKGQRVRGAHEMAVGSALSDRRSAGRMLRPRACEDARRGARVLERGSTLFCWARRPLRLESLGEEPLPCRWIYAFHCR